MWITWKHDDQKIPWPPSFEQKVDIFYHRLLGWQLHVADLVSNGGKPLAKVGEELETLRTIPHSGFAVLQICLSYFETMAQYQRVNPSTKCDGDFFREGVHAVFPELGKRRPAEIDAFLNILYKNARCGLYHSSMTRVGVGLGQPGNNIAMAFNPANKQLVIDPHVLPRTLKAHLESYRQQLLDSNNSDLRRNFEMQFNKDNGF
jgi:hypothetical protein